MKFPLYISVSGQVNIVIDEYTYEHSFPNYTYTILAPYKIYSEELYHSLYEAIAAAYIQVYNDSLPF